MATKKKFTIVGNWKMNPDTLEDAKKLFGGLNKLAAKASEVNVIIVSPAPFISVLSKGKLSAHIAAQDVGVEPRGAHTGTVSALQLKSVGATHALIGHGERRTAGDTNEMVAKKTVQALDAGLTVIFCVGEKERDANAKYLNVIREQILSVLSLVDKKKISSLAIGYEPIWAIGKSADMAPKPHDIHEMAIYIKKVVAEVLDKKAALKFPVLYGGSVTPDNASSILAQGGVDGFVLGRPSLDPHVFAQILSVCR